MRKILKTASFCIIALAVAALSGYGSYVITSKVLERGSGEIRARENEIKVPSTEVSAIADAQDISENTDFNYYMVKLEDDILNIYVNYEEHEELLYGEKINVGDLSDEDKQTLQTGVELEEMSKVTEFIENFTS